MAKSIARRRMRRTAADRRSLVALVGLAGGWGLLTGVAAASPTINTVAGGGPLTGDGVSALQASLAFPNGVEAAPSGFFVVDQSRHRVRRVSAGPPAADTGTIATFAGTGEFGDGMAILGGSPTAVSLHLPCCVARTAAGHLLIADTFGGMVQQVAGTRLDTVAGTGRPSSCPSTAPANVGALSAQLCFVVGIGAHPSDGRFLVAEDGLPDQDRTGGARVYEVDPGGVLRIVAGGGCPTPPANPGPLQICLERPRGPVYTGNPASPTEFLVADRGRHVVWRISSTSPALASAARVAGTGSPTAPDLQDLGDGGPAGLATLAGPSDLAMAPGGDYLIADRNNCRVRRVGGVSAADAITTVAGTTCASDAPRGDGGPATEASLRQPQGVSFAPGGILVSDTGRGLVRLVDRTTITAGPPPISTDPTAVFEFVSTEQPAAFACSLDDEVPSPCESPLRLPGLPDGAHSFRVADSEIPADPSPAVRKWILDTRPPEPFALVAPPDGAVEQPPQPLFEWRPADDATSGVERYEIWVDGERLQTLDPAACQAGMCRARAVAPLAEARHDWEVRAVDRAGLVRRSDAWTADVGSAPMAQLVAAPNPVLVDSTVVLDATASSDPDGPIARFEWDLDGDGEYERDTGAQGLTTMSYPVPGIVTVSVRVTDAVGRTAAATRPVRVSEPPDAPETYGVTIDGGAAFTGDRNVKLRAAFPSGTTSVLVSNDGGFLGAAVFDPARELDWRLPSTGPERLPKTVYVRFRSGPFVSETYTDDIVLDETAPRVDSVQLARAGGSGGATAASAARRRRWVVSTRARDNVSGVARMQVTSDRRRGGVTRRFARRRTVVSKVSRLWVRVLDGAGNRSRWRLARYSGPR